MKKKANNFVLKDIISEDSNQDSTQKKKEKK